MCTRATYQFKPLIGSYKPVVTLYIHWDGYCRGAASYFGAAVRNESGKGFAERFLRANELAEFTGGHDAHADTEYQYTLSGNALYVTESCYVGYSKRWAANFAGSLADFLNRHHDESGVWIEYANATRHIADVEKQFEALVHSRIDLFARGHFGNASIYGQDIPEPDLLARFSRNTQEAFAAHQATVAAYWAKDRVVNE